MSTKKTLNEQIEAARTEIRQKENRLKELVQKQKAEERKARTRRLCERAGYLESILPETITLTKEQFQAFLNMTLLNDFARRTLDVVTSGGGNGAGIDDFGEKLRRMDET
jgi:hypothetical protein